MVLPTRASLGWGRRLADGLLAGLRGLFLARADLGFVLDLLPLEAFLRPGFNLALWPHVFYKESPANSKLFCQLSLPGFLCCTRSKQPSAISALDNVPDIPQAASRLYLLLHTECPIARHTILANIKNSSRGRWRAVDPVELIITGNANCLKSENTSSWYFRLFWYFRRLF